MCISKPKFSQRGVTELVYIVYTMSHAKYFHLWYMKYNYWQLTHCSCLCMSDLWFIIDNTIPQLQYHRIITWYYKWNNLFYSTMHGFLIVVIALHICHAYHRYYMVIPLLTPLDMKLQAVEWKKLLCLLFLLSLYTTCHYIRWIWVMEKIEPSRITAAYLAPPGQSRY